MIISPIKNKERELEIRIVGGLKLNLECLKGGYKDNFYPISSLQTYFPF